LDENGGKAPATCRSNLISVPVVLEVRYRLGSPNNGSTPFSKRVMAQIRSSLRVRTMRPTHDGCSLDEVANVAAFVASDQASGMTGTIINLTMGGLDD
jgi:NAD(P)-dependent dehydrogenase (short-subunit alcohol dehydrogenase family)